MATSNVSATSTNALVGAKDTAKKDPHFTMTLHDYEESLGRLLIQKGVRGVAVTSRDGEVTYYNNNIPPKIVQAYTKACLDLEYLCTVIARQNDPYTRLFYIRVETDKYEMVASVENTHLAFMYCDPAETYNGENLLDGDGNDDE